MRTIKRQLFYDFADTAEVKILEDTLRKEDKNEQDLNLIGCFFKQVMLIDQMSRLLGSLMKRLYDGFRVEVLKKDEFVFEQGYQDECLYVILKGNAQSYEKKDKILDKQKQKEDKQEVERQQLDDSIGGVQCKEECIITNIDKNDDKQTVNDSRRVNSIKQQQEFENDVRNMVYQPELQQEFTLRRDNRLDKEVREMIRERQKVIVEKRRQEELWKNLRENTIAQMKLKSIVKKMMAKKDEAATKKDFFSGSKIMMKRFLWKSTDPKLKLKQQEGLNGVGISAIKKDISQSLKKSGSNSTLLNSQLFSRRASRVQQSFIQQTDSQQLKYGLSLFGNEIIEEQELEILDGNGLNNLKEEEPFRQLKMGQFQWGAGQVFGEEALKTRGFCREYSVAASSEELRIAILSRETFEEVLFCFYEEELNKEISFLGSCSLFQNFNEQELEQILLKLVQVTCEKDAILFKEGDVPEKLFLVREGDVLLDQEIESSKISGNLDCKKEEYLYASSFHPQKKKRHKIAIIGPGQIFGESEILKGCKERTTRAKALNATCKFYTFDLDQIKFLQDNSDLKDTLMEVRQNKSSWRAKRKQNCSLATEQAEEIPFITLPRDNNDLLEKRKHYELLQESEIRKTIQNELKINGQNFNLTYNQQNIISPKNPNIKQKLNYPKTCVTKRRSSKQNFSVDLHKLRNSTSNTANSTNEDNKTLWTPQNQKPFNPNNSLDLYSVEPISPFFIHLSTECNPFQPSYSPQEFQFSKRKTTNSLTQQDRSYSPRTTYFKTTTCTEVSPRKQQYHSSNGFPSKNQLLHLSELQQNNIVNSNKTSPKYQTDSTHQRNQSSEFYQTSLASQGNISLNNTTLNFQQSAISPRKRIIPRILSCIKPNSNQSLERISIEDQQHLQEKQILQQQEELFDSLNPIKERAEALANTARIINSNQDGNHKKTRRMFIYENEELENLYKKSLLKPKQKLNKLVQEIKQTKKAIDTSKEVANPQQKESSIFSYKDGYRQMSHSERAQLRELVKQNTLGEISYLKDQKQIEESTNIIETMNEQQTPRYRLKSMRQILESYNQIQNFSYLNKLDSFLTLKQQIFPSQ